MELSFRRDFIKIALVSNKIFWNYNDAVAVLNKSIKMNIIKKYKLISSWKKHTNNEQPTTDTSITNKIWLVSGQQSKRVNIK